jgi:hypothetical protein
LKLGWPNPIFKPLPLFGTLFFEDALFNEGMKSTHAFIKKRIFKEKRKVPKWMFFLTYLFLFTFNSCVWRMYLVKLWTLA